MPASLSKAARGYSRLNSVMAAAMSLIRVFPASELRRLIFLGNHYPFSTDNFIMTAAYFAVAAPTVPASFVVFRYLLSPAFS